MNHIVTFLSENPLGIGLAVVLIASPLFIFNRLALTANHSKVIKTVALLGLAGGVLWRAFAGKFVIPTLPWEAMLAVALLHAATGGYFGAENADFTRARIKDADYLSDEQKEKLLLDLSNKKKK